MFPNGWPGRALLLLRAGASLLLIRDGALTLLHPTATITDIVIVLAAMSGLFLLVGFWTPFAGFTLACLEVAMLVMQTEPRAPLLYTVFAIAIALLGPGRISLDAHLYGRQRINLSDD